MSFAVPGKIIEEFSVRRNGVGLVQFGDTNRPIFLDLVPDAHVGDYVRVHVGFARELFSSSKISQACERDPVTGYAVMKKLLDLVAERLDATRLQLARVTIQ